MRTTVDLDHPTEMEVIRAWQHLAGHGEGVVHGRVSSSGTGVHLKVHGCDPETVKELRSLTGDDPKRRDFDQKSGLKPQQILFSEKPTGEGAGEWTTDRDHLIAEYRRRAPVSVRYPDAAKRLP